MSPQQRAARDRMMDGLRKRRATSAAAINRHSNTVTIIKKLLPVAAVLLLVALAIAPSLRLGPDANRVVYHVNQATAGSDTASAMQNAKYHGIDQHGQPFTLTASTATDQGADDVALVAPEGDITLNSGAWLVLKSDTGLFNQKSQNLGLTGHVTLYRNDGTILNVDTASINLHAISANSAAPVQVQGPFGTLTAANGFAVTDRGATITFNGPATLVLAQAGTSAFPQ